MTQCNEFHRGDFPTDIVVIYYNRWFFGSSKRSYASSYNGNIFVLDSSKEDIIKEAELNSFPWVVIRIHNQSDSYTIIEKSEKKHSGEGIK